MRARAHIDLILSVIERYRWLIADDALSYELDEDADTVLVSGRLTFVDSTVLSFAESILPSGVRYRYHYMRSDGTLIFRYDNAPHHPQLPTFPHHKHTPEGIEPSQPKLLNEVLVEIQNAILKSGQPTGGWRQD